MRPIAGTLHLQTLAGVTNVSSNPSCQRNGASKSSALGLVFAETIPTACSLWERIVLFVPVSWTRWEGRYSHSRKAGRRDWAVGKAKESIRRLESSGEAALRLITSLYSVFHLRRVYQIKRPAIHWSLKTPPDMESAVTWRNTAVAATALDVVNLLYNINTGTEN